MTQQTKDGFIAYFNEAKEYFISCHQHPINIFLHHLVNVIAIIGVVYIFIDIWVSVICLVLTQIFAIGGHIFFEKNKPAFMKYPGVTIPAAMYWSFENLFGLRQLLNAMKKDKKNV